MSGSALGRLYQGPRELEAEETGIALRRKKALYAVREAVEGRGVRQFAKEAGGSYMHLIEALSGKEERLSQGILEKVDVAVVRMVTAR